MTGKTIKSIRLTARQRELLLEALNLSYQHTLALKRMAGQRRYATKDKHQETLRELRLLIEQFS